MKTYLLKNWKTTIVGILALAGVITTYWLPQYKEELAYVISTLTGLGFIVAKDGDKTGI